MITLLNVIKDTYQFIHPMDICENENLTNFTTCKSALDYHRAGFDGQNCGLPEHILDDMPSLTYSIVKETYFEDILSVEGFNKNQKLQTAYENVFIKTFLADWVGPNTNNLARDLNEKIQ